MSDEITLTMPRSEAYHGIAHLVLSGLAARLGFSVESLDDLQLALDGLLERRSPTPRSIFLSLRVEGDELQARLGPFDDGLRAELEGGAAAADLDLGRLLGTVVDRVELSESDEGPWVELRKTVRAEAA